MPDQFIRNYENIMLQDCTMLYYLYLTALCAEIDITINCCHIKNFETVPFKNF